MGSGLPLVRTPPTSVAARGRLAEDIALAWLLLSGLTVLDRNRRGDGGEIDLIARDGDCLVFVEVRQRRSRSWVGASESVDARKRARLRACARRLLASREDLRWPGRTLRFDVVTLTTDTSTVVVEHLRAVRI